MNERIGEKINRLKRIVRLRLQLNVRWNKADVVVTGEEVAIEWSEPKIPGYEFHRKSTSIKHLSRFVKQQEGKLYNEFKNRKDPDYKLKV